MISFWSLSAYILMAQRIIALAGETHLKKGLFGVEQGKVLQGHVFEKYHVTSSMQCSFMCTKHQSCFSYNYKDSGSLDLCELNNATRKTDPGSYQDDAEYKHYYDLQTETSRSCVDYLRNGATENGIYTITDISGDSYPVWCDVTSEPRSAWTLILSLALKNRHTSIACKRSLRVNLPANENSPNWEAYRLSMNRMKLLASQSTHWRATTGFNIYGIDYTDYIRGKLSDFDILKDIGDGTCKTVEYVNIRGHKATAIQVAFWQRDGTFFLHTDSRYASCPFKPNIGSVSSENNFGFYCEVIGPSIKTSEDRKTKTARQSGGSEDTCRRNSHHNSICN